MPYRQVLRADKEGDQFAAHARRHALRVARSASQQFPHLLGDDQEFLDLYQFQLALGERLEGLQQELIDFDDRHAGELEKDRKMRARRDELASALREQLFRVKGTSDSHFGAGSSGEILQETPARLPREAKALYRAGLRAFKHLNDPDFDLKPQQSGVWIHPKLWARGFQNNLNELGAVLKWLKDTESETQHTQSLKDDILERLERANLEAVRFFEALYVVAGHLRLAKRLRRSSHVRKGESSAGEGDAPDGNGPSGNGPSGNGPSGDGPSGGGPSGDAPGDTPSGDTPGREDLVGEGLTGSRLTGNSLTGRAPTPDAGNRQPPTTEPTQKS